MYIYTHTYTLNIYKYTIQDKQKHFTFIIKHFTISYTELTFFISFEL